MLVFQPTIKKCLVGVVNGLTRDCFLREDLLQEATIHFWKAECERPGQTLSWYLQSCSFHLRHYLTSGRSIDSSKRRNLQIELPADEDLCSYMEWFGVEQSVLAEVEIRECIRLLPRYLTPREQAILRCLFEGLRPREIARHLILSHPTVNKCRRRIAALAIRLGLAPGGGIKSDRPVRVIRNKVDRAEPQGQPPVVGGIPEAQGECLREQRGENGHAKRQAAGANGISPATAKTVGRERCNTERLAPSQLESPPRVRFDRDPIAA